MRSHFKISRLVSSFPLLVLILFLICLLLQIYYPLFIHLSLARLKVAEEMGADCMPVSVIICARNEEKNLKENLSLVLDQDYPEFEVVVVNDRSMDDTRFVLQEYSKKYQNLKVVTIDEHGRMKQGKKFAVTMGIKAAKHEHLVFTDADCRPSSANWLRRMQESFSDQTEIVLGYSPYEKMASFVNRLIRFETFYTALNYLSFSLKGNAYMGVGRNMAYKKSLFFRSKGFASHLHIPSGDDDLFVNQNANRYNTSIVIHPEAYVWSEPKHTFSEYVNQKVRHLGAGKAYKTRHKFALTLQALSAILFYTLLIVLLFLPVPIWLVLGAYFVRILVMLAIYAQVLKKLEYSDLIPWFPAFDLIYYFYILSLNIITLFKKKVQWR